MKTLLNTTIKEEWRVTEFKNFEYPLRHLENEAELGAMIAEAEKILVTCAHCGANGSVMYYYNPCKDFPRVAKYSEEPNKIEMVMIPYPHALCVQCSGHRGEKFENRCEMRTKVWHAEDDEADFKEALRRVVNAWNRRPGDP